MIWTAPLIAILGWPHVVIATTFMLYALAKKRTFPAVPSPALDLLSVEVVIPVRGELTQCQQLLDRLSERETFVNIVVLQSDPTCSAMDAASHWETSTHAWGRLERGPELPGFKAGVLNMWLRRSTADIVVVLDADWIVELKDVEELASALNQNQEAAFAQGRWSFRNADDSWISRADASALRFHHVIEQGTRASWRVAPNMNGSLTAIRRCEAMMVGGFDLTQISEDIDLSMRLLENGKRGIYVPSVCGAGMLAMSLAEYRQQKPRWSAGRTQGLLRHSGFMATRGPIRERLGNLSFFLEYATSLGSIAMLVLLSFVTVPPSAGLIALGVIAAPALTRLALSAKCEGTSAERNRQRTSALADAVLRTAFSTTNAVLTVLTLFGWRPAWKWRAGRRAMSTVSLGSVASLLATWQFVQGPAAKVAWAQLMILSVLSCALWLSPSMLRTLDEVDQKENVHEPATQA